MRIRNKILDEFDDLRMDFVKGNNLFYLPIANDTSDTDYEFDIENLEKNAERFGIKEFIVMCKDFDIDADCVTEFENVNGNDELYAYRVESKRLDTDFWPILQECYSHVLFFDPDFKFIGLTSCDDYRVYASSQEILECVTGRTIDETVDELCKFINPRLGEYDPRYR